MFKDFSKICVKVVVLFCPPGVSNVNLRYVTLVNPNMYDVGQSFPYWLVLKWYTLISLKIGIVDKSQEPLNLIFFRSFNAYLNDS